jgi:hypothetical protein
MSSVYRILNCTVTGDSSNTARFFSVLYSDVRKPVNPLLTSGLEIAVYSSGSLSFLETLRVKELINRSDNLEETIRKAIYG